MTGPEIEREQGQLIYQCTDGGQVVLSDRPCGPEAGSRWISPADINVHEAPSVSRRRSHGLRQSRVTPATADRAPAGKEEKATCERIAVELERMQSRMRAGYRAREGERLRERQRRLKERRYSLGCRLR